MILNVSLFARCICVVSTTDGCSACFGSSVLCGGSPCRAFSFPRFASLSAIGHYWSVADVLLAVEAVFAAAVFKGLGYAVKPLPEERRSDIIQAITLESKQRLCVFCVAIQGNSPVDAHVEPVPSPLPGYLDEIILAAGTFVQGASIELSADGPCREPFNVFFQGGLTFEHGRLAIMAAAKRVGPKEA